LQYAFEQERRPIRMPEAAKGRDNLKRIDFALSFFSALSAPLDFMKLDRLQEYFTVFCVTTGGVLAGIYCGQLAANGDTRKLGYIAAAIAAMIICLGK